MYLQDLERYTLCWFLHLVGIALEAVPFLSELRGDKPLFVITNI